MEKVMTDKQHNESKLERVIRKIKRCSALSKSSNENEAATAMRQAQSLMREYRLTELDVQLSDIGEAESASVRVTPGSPDRAVRLRDSADKAH